MSKYIILTTCSCSSSWTCSKTQWYNTLHTFNRHCNAWDLWI